MGEWIPLMVRAEDYLELAGLVADREQGRPDAVPGPAAVAAGDDAAARDELDLLVPWDEKALIQLAEGRTVTTRRWTLAMDVCSRHVGQFLSTEQVAAEAGMEVTEWRDAPRKISRHLEAHYDVPGWPLKGIDARRIGKNDGQVYWGINQEQALRWRRVRSGQRPSR